MRIFSNRLSGVKWYALDDAVTDEGDAWRIRYANVSLPKREWEELGKKRNLTYYKMRDV